MLTHQKSPSPRTPLSILCPHHHMLRTSLGLLWVSSSRRIISLMSMAATRVLPLPVSIMAMTFSCRAFSYISSWYCRGIKGGPSIGSSGVSLEVLWSVITDADDDDGASRDVIGACEGDAVATGGGAGSTTGASSGELQSGVENPGVKAGGGAIRGLDSVSGIEELSRPAVDLGDTGLSGRCDTELAAMLDVVFGANVVLTLAGAD